MFCRNVNGLEFAGFLPLVSATYTCACFKTKLGNTNFEETSGLELTRELKPGNNLMERPCVFMQGERTKHRDTVSMQLRKRGLLLPGDTALSQSAACCPVLWAVVQALFIPFAYTLVQAPLHIWSPRCVHFYWP